MKIIMEITQSEIDERFGYGVIVKTNDVQIVTEEQVKQAFHVQENAELSIVPEVMEAPTDLE